MALGTGGQKTIDITWPTGAVTGITGTLQRDTTASFTAPTSQTVNWPTTAVTQTSLAIGTTYYWRFKVDRGGGKFESAWSTSINGTPDEA